MFREYYSWNIYETFPRHISRIFRKSSKWNSGKYSQIMFWEYWIMEYSLIVAWISYECYMHSFRWIKKYNSGQSCSWYSLSVSENLIFSWNPSKYVTIASNSLTTNYNYNYNLITNYNYFKGLNNIEKPTKSLSIM